MTILEIEKALKEPFAYQDLDWRVARAGQNNNGPWASVLTYVTSRAIQNRLDLVFGIDGWWDEYTAGPNGGVLCTLNVKIERGEGKAPVWIAKQGIADNTNIEAVKGGESGALKRAAVKFGIGRYLYKLTETWAIVDPQGKNYQGAKSGKHPAFRWNPPPLPDWALPSSTVEKAAKVFEGTVQGENNAV